ncbi:hypothetical protein ACVPOR_03210 [Staphylococcus aureus]
MSSEVEKGESIKTAIREGLLSHVQTVGKSASPLPQPTNALRFRIKSSET